MSKVSLVPHNKIYAKSMSALSSSPQVKAALGLTNDQTSLEGTIGFIEFIREQERLGKQYSRAILNETENLIGVITLKDIDNINKTSHIGTWIGNQYWGQGYNLLAKREILYKAFTELNLDYVFAGAKTSNIRSMKSQEKLPFMRIEVQKEFPDEHRKLESEVNASCILNVVEKDMFLKWILQTE
ncbi:GNAT family N-acetyltransferase [Sporosarcina sp. Marseille-Q4063]|uniref:GNAT family N-acetyltransferase n=1 Tax=Sporosarcina sp. Marseille-Q4063 TaxID=2810514 RepID=UPI001BAEB4DE|nr:GNAT family N-acetyltransferase [Sporosarcina sp. Marseille-Q4063]QUW22605.1 GNAT family N-acetyltransferase [Sporosarcina sp. Marseille-Q4063]